RMQFIGEKGSLDVDIEKQGGILYSEENDKSVFMPWGDDMNYLMIRDFIDCLEGDRPSPVTGADGLFALEAALMAYESIEKNMVISKK
ncbi:MAG: gfo/Idh/MocA family oxidoreductase, partial [Clostridiales bacterium]|nr:gfo/Idh/MocA family oxidoreductase [Clostridiales bacterium]